MVRRTCSVALFLVSSVAAPSQGATLLVPSEYPTIQSAIDAAVAGDTVLLAPGEYTEYVVRSVPGFGSVRAMAFLKEGVRVRGQAGAGGTVLRHVAGPGGSGLIAHGTTVATVVEGITIDGDWLASYGGISVLNTESLTVQDCEFYELVGGIWVNFSQGLTATDCHFEDCFEVGGIRAGGGLVLITRCTFVRCQHSGVDLSGDGFEDRGEIRECVFRDCVREDPGGGGGGGLQVGNYGGGVVVDGCSFWNNRTNRYGGGVAIGGSTPNPVVSNCVFFGNEATALGGAALISAIGVAQVTGNTIVSSHLTEPLGDGGAALYFAGDGLAQLDRNVFSGTSAAPAITGAIQFESSCNIFWDNPAGIAGGSYAPGPTDRTADPMFCDPPAGDLELNADSPCLPEHSLGCGLIGALGQGCGTVAVQPTTWGRLKAAYRDWRGE